MRTTRVNHQIADMYAQARQSLQTARQMDNRALNATNPQDNAKFKVLAKQYRAEKQTWLDAIKQTAQRYTELSAVEVFRQLDRELSNMSSRLVTTHKKQK